jgi:hypothetical protein
MPPCHQKHTGYRRAVAKPIHLSSAVITATLAVVACSAAPRGTADPAPPPFPIGQVGVPVHARAASGATADVTLNSAAWFPQGCAGGWECNVIELTITGTSPTPFKYSETYVVSGYGGGDQPFTQPDDNHWLGGDYKVDYQKINKMPPLRTGSVTTGQTAHGFIGYGCNECRRSGERGLYIKMIDPDTENPTSPGPFAVVEAGWEVHT